MAGKKDQAVATKTETNGNGNGGGALAVAEPMALANDWIGDELGDASFDLPTGTEEMGREDVRIPTWALNAKGTNIETGRPVAIDEFWNTLSGEAKARLRLVVLSNHKSRAWRENDKATNKPVDRCRSWDNVTGQMEDGSERPCKGCPDYEWRTDAVTKKRSRRCGDIHNLLVMDRETSEIAMVRVKKAATKAVKEFYQKYFHKKRRVEQTDQSGKKRMVFLDFPFFVFETVVESKMVSDNAGHNWAVPVFTIGGRLMKEEILVCADLVRSYLTDFVDRVRTSAEAADRVDTSEPDGEVIDGTTAAPIDSNEFKDDAASDGAVRF